MLFLGGGTVVLVPSSHQYTQTPGRKDRAQKKRKNMTARLYHEYSERYHSRTAICTRQTVLVNARVSTTLRKNNLLPFSFQVFRDRVMMTAN